MDSFAKMIEDSKDIKALPKEMIVPEKERDSYYRHFTLKVKSLSEFVAIISILSRSLEESESCLSDHLAFRGHSNASADYSLTPSLARKRGSLEFSENAMVKEMLTLRPEEFTDIKSNFNLLSKLQHFGLPTRLLDFTYNPLIALFFACIGESLEDGRVICTYDTSDSSTTSMIEAICGTYQHTDYNATPLDRLIGGVAQLNRYANATMELLMAKPLYANDRIKHQSAVLMVFPNKVCDLRSRMSVMGQRGENEREYLQFPLTEEEKRRLEYVRREPEIYDDSFQVTSVTIRKLLKHYEKQFTDFRNDEGAINPKYEFIFKNRFSVRNSIQEIGEDMLSNAFVSIIVEADYKKKLLEELAMIGINKAFVFPELEYTAEMVGQLF